MARESHSEKGLKTIEMMGTKASDWSLTPIKWKYIEILAPMKVKCPDCHGNGRTYVNNETGKVAKDANFENINDRTEGGWKSKNTYRNCPTCWSGRGYKGSGEVTEMRKQKMLVGTPVWAKGTQFDSRFADKVYERDVTAKDKIVRCVCDLCSKSITGVWSYRVPVQARGADGKIHGMWVGQDCAKKFLGIQVVLTADQKTEMKDSEVKNWTIMESLPEGK